MQSQAQAVTAALGSTAGSETYQRLVQKVKESHEQGRRADRLHADDIDLARLYTYAFRTHTIGGFHGTRLALTSHATHNTLANAHVQRAIEQLEDLADQGMDLVPEDFRVVLSSFYRYDRGVGRVTDAISAAYQASGDPTLGGIGARFQEIMGEISNSSGIYLSRDIGAPEQASFIVPNLGISIVPLMYGDHHSWNLAYLTPELLDVPNHRHFYGVEIHLGYAPLEGYMVLADHKAPVTEGYALPIPPKTRHGWINTSGNIHHVPFIFGSLRHAGWGVFMDVEAMPIPPDDLETVERDHWKMGPTIFLEREIRNVAASMMSGRSVLIPARVMDRGGSGGLELALTRANQAGFSYPIDDFRIGSVVGGKGRLQIGPAECDVAPHDHFGIPAGMTASLRQIGDEPLVVLDSMIKTM